VAIVFAQTLVFAESNFSLMAGGTIVFAGSLWVVLKVLESTGDNVTPGIRGKRSRPRSGPFKNSAADKPAL
jgi:hypothetical protein